MFAVTFRIFSVFKNGVNKGKPNPESFHTLTLYRDPSKLETVGDTLKRAKSMFSGEGTRIVLLNPGRETEAERQARYKREGLEVIVKKNSANPTAETFLGDMNLFPITHLAMEAVAAQPASV